MDNVNLTNVLTFASTLAVFVLAANQLVKNTINLPKNIIPLVGLVLGLVIGGLAAPFTDLNLTLRLWAGAISGLSATGLFELAFSNRSGTTKEDRKDNKFL